MVCLIMGTSAFSQLEQGTILLDGSSNLGFLNETFSEDSFESSISQTIVVANGGFFITDGLVVGLEANYTSLVQTQGDGIDDLEISITTTTVSPIVRYYVKDIGVWGQAGYGYGNSSTSMSLTGENPIPPSESTISVLSLQLGYAYFLAENVSINPSLGYVQRTTEIEDESQTLSGMNLRIGFAIHFNKAALKTTD